MNLRGALAKMQSTVDSTGKVDYRLPVGEHLIDLNALLGKTIRLEYTEKIHCAYCGCAIKKSYQQGHCFLATQRLAQCDLCILKPELCHYDQGTCREPTWGEAHCLQAHYVYLANSSGVKVGITRGQNIPTRWVDQGALQALPVFQVASRWVSGLVEVTLAQLIADKTNWRKMLKNEVPLVDMIAVRDNLLPQIAAQINALKARLGNAAIEYLPAAKPQMLFYPVQQYPVTVKSLNFDKNPKVEGSLMGVKGQYLIFEHGVINIRKFTGYDIDFSCSHNVDVQTGPLIKAAVRCPFSV